MAREIDLLKHIANNRETTIHASCTLFLLS